MNLIPVRKYYAEREVQIEYINPDYITHIQAGDNPNSAQIFFSSGTYMWAHETVEDVMDKIREFEDV